LKCSPQEIGILLNLRIKKVRPPIERPLEELGMALKLRMTKVGVHYKWLRLKIQHFARMLQKRSNMLLGGVGP
jgi:hypothetical protein